MNDRISLIGVSTRCRVGVPARERKKRQEIELDVILETDLRRAGRTDSLKHAVDYYGLEASLRKKAEGASFKLIERLAEVLSETVLRYDKRIKAVTVTVRKKPAVMPKTREVSVTIRRKR